MRRLLCLVKRHKWDGCTCLKCGITRDHEWDGCKCKNCKAAREHDWDHGCVCQRCGVGREHDWDGCKCRRCQATRDHDWDGCTCLKCGITRDHEWDGCKCKNCKAAREHDWDHGCVCQRCGVGREHDWDGCKCRRCQATRDHDWDGYTCRRCGACEHEWDGCRCRRCDATREHDWADSGCRRCGATHDHDWDGCKCRLCNAAREHQWHGYICRNCGANSLLFITDSKELDQIGRSPLSGDDGRKFITLATHNQLLVAHIALYTPAPALKEFALAKLTDVDALAWLVAQPIPRNWSSIQQQALEQLGTKAPATVLENIVRFAGDSYLKRAAVRLIRDQDILVRLSKTVLDGPVSEAIAERLLDEVALAELVASGILTWEEKMHPYERHGPLYVSSADKALKRLNDPRALCIVAASNEDCNRRALNMLRSKFADNTSEAQKYYRIVAAQCTAPTICEEVVQLLDELSLSTVAESPESRTANRIAAVGRIRDQSTLRRLIMGDPINEVRAAAVANLTDEVELLELVRNATEAAIREAAIQAPALNNPALMASIAIERERIDRGVCERAIGCILDMDVLNQVEGQLSAFWALNAVSRQRTKCETIRNEEERKRKMASATLLCPMCFEGPRRWSSSSLECKRCGIVWSVTRETDCIWMVRNFRDGSKLSYCISECRACGRFSFYTECTPHTAHEHRCASCPESYRPGGP